MNFYLTVSKKKRKVSFLTFALAMSILVPIVMLITGGIVSLVLWPFFGFSWPIIVAGGAGFVLGCVEWK